jgi:lysophospholipase L1-like esterase
MLKLLQAMVGLSNVDNTSDLNKPISTATQNYEEASDIDTQIWRAELLIDEVDNTSDLDKPISTATQNALNNIDVNLSYLEANAESIVKSHNSNLNFVSFVDTSTSTPAGVVNNAYIAIEDGTIFGISNVKKADIISYKGTAFVSETPSVILTTTDVNNPNNLINNDFITQYQGLSYKLLMPVKLEELTSYNLSSKNYSSGGIQLLILNQSFTTIQTLLDYENFTGREGITFSTNSGVEGDVYLMFRTISTDISALKGTFQLSRVVLEFEDGFTKYQPTPATTFLNKDNVDFIESENIYVTDWRSGFTLLNTGGVATSALQDISRFMRVNGGKKYYVNFAFTRINEYDLNGTFIKTTLAQSNLVASDWYFIDLDEDTVFVRLSKLTATNTTEMVFCPSPYMERISFAEAQKDRLKSDLIVYPTKKSDYDNLKLTTDGDSIVAQGLWQFYLTREIPFLSLTNTGVGGSKVVDMADTARINAIPADSELILLNGGTNDFSQDIPLGTIASAADLTTYYGAYKLRLNRLYARCPDAIVMIMGAPYKSNEKTPNLVSAVLADYNQANKEIAELYGYKFIDIRNLMGVNSLNYLDYISDGTHPSVSTGAKKYAEVVISTLKSSINLPYYLL